MRFLLRCFTASSSSKEVDEGRIVPHHVEGTTCADILAENNQLKGNITTEEFRNGGPWVVYTSQLGPIPGVWAVTAIYPPGIAPKHESSVLTFNIEGWPLGLHVVQASPFMARDVLLAANPQTLTVAATAVALAAKTPGLTQLPPATLHTVSKRCTRHALSPAEAAARCAACTSGTLIAQPCKWLPSQQPPSSRRQQNGPTPMSDPVPALLLQYVPTHHPSAPPTPIKHAPSLRNEPVSNGATAAPHPKASGSMHSVEVAAAVAPPDTHLPVVAQPLTPASTTTPSPSSSVQLHQALALLDATPVILTLVGPGGAVARGNAMPCPCRAQLCCTVPRVWLCHLHLCPPTLVPAPMRDMHVIGAPIPEPRIPNPWTCFACASQVSASGDVVWMNTCGSQYMGLDPSPPSARQRAVASGFWQALFSLEEGYGEEMMQALSQGQTWTRVCKVPSLLGPKLRGVEEACEGDGGQGWDRGPGAGGGVDQHTLPTVPENPCAPEDGASKDVWGMGLEMPSSGMLSVGALRTANSTVGVEQDIAAALPTITPPPSPYMTNMSHHLCAVSGSSGVVGGTSVAGVARTVSSMSVLSAQIACVPSPHAPSSAAMTAQHGTMPTRHHSSIPSLSSVEGLEVRGDRSSASRSQNLTPSTTSAALRHISDNATSNGSVRSLPGMGGLSSGAHQRSYQRTISSSLLAQALRGTPERPTPSLQPSMAGTMQQAGMGKARAARTAVSDTNFAALPSGAWLRTGSLPHSLQGSHCASAEPTSHPLTQSTTHTSGGHNSTRPAAQLGPQAQKAASVAAAVAAAGSLDTLTGLSSLQLPPSSGPAGITLLTSEALFSTGDNNSHASQGLMSLVPSAKGTYPPTPPWRHSIDDYTARTGSGGLPTLPGGASMPRPIIRRSSSTGDRDSRGCATSHNALTTANASLHHASTTSNITPAFTPPSRGHAGIGRRLHSLLFIPDLPGRDVYSRCMLSEEYEDVEEPLSVTRSAQSCMVNPHAPVTFSLASRAKDSCQLPPKFSRVSGTAIDAPSTASCKAAAGERVLPYLCPLPPPAPTALCSYSSPTFRCPLRACSLSCSLLASSSFHWASFYHPPLTPLPL